MWNFVKVVNFCPVLSSILFIIGLICKALMTIGHWSVSNILKQIFTALQFLLINCIREIQETNLPTSQSQLQLNPGPNCQFRPNFGASWFLDSPMPQSTDGQTNYIMLDNGFYSRVNQVFTLNVGLRIPFQVYRNDDILMHIFRHLHFNTCWYFFWKNPKPKRGHFILRKIHLLIYYEKPGSFIQMA